ncbi:MAG: sulfite exporter TauE/SafE family protein [Pirellulales bacterium]|nr:sulfite exporter TauE/SafE family protein [Pirellulales bacterium]
MATYLLFVAAALILGLATSISPCPMATNIAAISYIGRKVESPGKVLLAGLLYTAGRCVVYAVLALLVAGLALSLDDVSIFFQTYASLVLGPIFLVLGMFFVGLLSTSVGGTLVSENMQKRIDAMGLPGAFLLGVLFALSFCPVSAGWFFGFLALLFGLEAGKVTEFLVTFGVMLPQMKCGMGDLAVLSLLYGLATGLPVLLVAFILAYSAERIGTTYNVLSKIEWGARMFTGWLFIGLGIFFCVYYVFEVG